MGLVKAIIVTGLSLFIIENIRKYQNKFFFFKSFLKKKFNYCYVLLLIVFIIELFV